MSSRRGNGGEQRDQRASARALGQLAGNSWGPASAPGLAGQPESQSPLYPVPSQGLPVKGLPAFLQCSEGGCAFVNMRIPVRFLQTRLHLPDSSARSSKPFCPSHDHLALPTALAMPAALYTLSPVGTLCLRTLQWSSLLQDALLRAVHVTSPSHPHLQHKQLPGRPHSAGCPPPRQ